MEPLIRRAMARDFDELRGYLSALPFLSNEFLVAVVDGRIAAFLAWRRVAEDECEILQIEAGAEFRGRGLGRALLQTLKKQEPGELFLEVRPSNTIALHLYDTEGFVRSGLRRNYYRFPDEDALVLKFHPC